MTDKAPNPVLRFMPSLTDVAFLMPAMMLFLKLGGAPSLLEGDTGWHIRTGEWILQNGAVPQKDMFSFTRPDAPWFAWEWLWDVLFALIHRNAGMAGVTLASLLLICLTVAVLYRLTREKCANPLIAIAITMLAMNCSSIHWLARPHLFTLLFILIFYSILESVRLGEDKRLLYLLPLLMILWTNLHGGFVAAFLLIGAYWAGQLITGWRKAPAPALPYFFAGVACAAASLVNPYGWQLHAHVWTYLAVTKFHFVNVMEFASFSFHHPAAGYFEAMLLLGVGGAFWSVRQKRYAHAILMLGWAHLALQSARNIPIFVFLAAPIGAWMISDWLRETAKGRVLTEFEAIGSELAETERFTRIPAASAIGAVLIALLVFGGRADYDPAKYPVAALKALDGTLTGKVFSDDEWGDYLIYRLYPRTKVFIDGRTDFYGDAFCRTHMQVIQARYNWADTLDRYGVEFVILPVDFSLTSALKLAPQWRVLHDDGIAIVFRRTETPVRRQTSSIVSQHIGSADPSKAAPHHSLEQGGSYVY